MTRFAYRAVDAAGNALNGRMEARDALELERNLARIGLDLVTQRPERLAHWPARAQRLARRDLIGLCFQLEQMLSAGVPMLEGLADLRDNAENARLRRVVAALVQAIEAGKLLSGAMAELPQAFDPVVVSMVRAGEESGSLPEILHRLTETLKWQDELSEQTLRMLLYPLFVVAVIAATFLFLMLHLVPQLSGFLQAMGRDLPLQTRILIALSGVVRSWWWLMIGAPLAALALVPATTRGTGAGRRLRDALALRLPWLGPILHRVLLARLAQLLSLMYGAGIPVPRAIALCDGPVGNLSLRAALARAGAQIEQGAGMAAAFKSAGLFSSLVIRMLRVGEATGRLDKALDSAAYFHLREVRESIARMHALIEPVLTVVMGVILGGLMLAVLGPVYDAIATTKIR